MSPSFAFIFMGKREPVALLGMSSLRFVNIDVMWIFLRVPWVGLQCVIVLFPEYIHLLF